MNKNKTIITTTALSVGLIGGFISLNHHQITNAATTNNSSSQSVANITVLSGSDLPTGTYNIQAGTMPVQSDSPSGGIHYINGNKNNVAYNLFNPDDTTNNTTTVNGINIISSSDYNTLSNLKWSDGSQVMSTDGVLDTYNDYHSKSNEGMLPLYLTNNGKNYHFMMNLLRNNKLPDNIKINSDATINFIPSKSTTRPTNGIMILVDVNNLKNDDPTLYQEFMNIPNLIQNPWHQTDETSNNLFLLPYSLTFTKGSQDIKINIPDAALKVLNTHIKLTHPNNKNITPNNLKINQELFTYGTLMTNGKAGIDTTITPILNKVVTPTINTNGHAGTSNASSQSSSASSSSAASNLVSSSSASSSSAASNLAEIHTSATGENNTKYVLGIQDETMTDTVYYKGLTPGKKYVMSGDFIDQNTGKDTGIKASEIFTASSTGEGSIVIHFKGNTAQFAGKKIVAFEKAQEVTSNTKVSDTQEAINAGKTVAVNNDIHDQAETLQVTTPLIHTEVKGTNDTKLVLGHGIQTMTDTIYYKGLIPGKQYVVSGNFVNQANGNNTNLKGSQIFTASSTGEGEVNVPFKGDVTKLAGKNIVAFEKVQEATANTKVSDTQEATNTGKTIATYNKINDKDETLQVTKPEIHTTATVNGAKNIKPNGQVIVKDHVEYSGMVPGVAMDMQGQMHNKDNGQAISDNSNQKFTPDKEQGSVDVNINVDASKMGQKGMVAYEKAIQLNNQSESNKTDYNGQIVATHENLDDEGQSIGQLNSKQAIIPTNKQTPSGKEQIDTTKQNTPINKEQTRTTKQNAPINGQQTETKTQELVETAEKFVNNNPLVIVAGITLILGASSAIILRKH